MSRAGRQEAEIGGEPNRVDRNLNLRWSPGQPVSERPVV